MFRSRGHDRVRPAAACLPALPLIYVDAAESIECVITIHSRHWRRFGPKDGASILPISERPRAGCRVAAGKRQQRAEVEAGDAQRAAVLLGKPRLVLAIPPAQRPPRHAQALLDVAR